MAHWGCHTEEKVWGVWCCGRSGMSLNPFGV